MWKVCLFYSHCQNNKILWLSNMTDTFWINSQYAQRYQYVWAFFLDLRFLGASLVDRQTHYHMDMIKQKNSHSCGISANCTDYLSRRSVKKGIKADFEISLCIDQQTLVNKYVIKWVHLWWNRNDKTRPENLLVNKRQHPVLTECI